MVKPAPTAPPAPKRAMARLYKLPHLTAPGTPNVLSTAFTTLGFCQALAKNIYIALHLLT